MIQKIYLILKELSGSKFISFIVFCVILISVIITIFFITISLNFDNYINKNFATSIPPDEIIVRQGKASGFFLFSESSGKILDQQTLKAISLIKGVERVEPVIAVSVPTSAVISFFTLTYRSDLICAGADYRFVEKNLKTPEAKRSWLKGETPQGIPVLVPRQLIDSYNNGLAAANDLPEIVPEKISGLKFKIIFGSSSLSTLPGYFEKQATIAGYTEKINLTGLIIPMAKAKEINQRFSRENRYIFASVKVKDHTWTEQVKNQIKKLNLSIDEGRIISPQILKLQSVVNYFIGLMITLIVALASLATGLCSATALWDRVEYYTILRILGASKIFIAFTILFKNAFSGFVAFWCGMIFIEKAKSYVVTYISCPGIKLQLQLPDEYIFITMTAATLIPAIASIPAIVRMFSSKLDRS